jgi:hypothetical protein
MYSPYPGYFLNNKNMRQWIYYTFIKIVMI